MKVYVNDPKHPGKRKVVEAKLVKENETNILVELQDGNVISRKKKRDLANETS